MAMNASFRARLGVAMALVAAVPLLFVGGYVVDLNRQTLQDVVRAQQAAVAYDLTHQLEHQLDVAASELFALRHALVMRDQTNEARLALASVLLESSRTLDHVTVFDASGIAIDTLKKDNFHASPLAAIDLGHARAGLAVADAAVVDDDVRLTLFVPIDVDGTRTGFVGTRLSLGRIAAAAQRLREATLSGTQDRLVVVDGLQRVLVEAPSTKTPLRDAHAEAVLSDLGDELLTMTTSFAKYGEIDAPTGKAVATVVSVPRFEMAVFVQQPADVVYASLARVRNVIAVAVVVAMLASAVLAAWASRRLSRPIAALAAYADKLGRRLWQERVTITTGDELETLGAAMNDAAQALFQSEQDITREREIRHDLGRFLPAPLVERVVADKSALALGGKRYEVSVLFADVCGFTELVRDREPEQAVALLNELFSILTEIVFRNGGTVDKFIGDCVMAFWGAPDACNHAELSVRCAQEMLRFLEVGNVRWRQTYGLDVTLAIGIATGTAVVGNIGSSSRLEYTAIGDTVNLAARLESVARPQQVLVSETTQRLSSARFFALGARPLPGYADPVAVYALQE